MGACGDEGHTRYRWVPSSAVKDATRELGDDAPVSIRDFVAINGRVDRAHEGVEDGASKREVVDEATVESNIDVLLGYETERTELALWLAESRVDIDYKTASGVEILDDPALDDRSTFLGGAVR